MTRFGLFLAAIGGASAIGIGCGGRDPEPESAPTHQLLAPEEVVAISFAPLGCGVRTTLKIAPGYHIMSNQPSEPQFIATNLSLVSPELALAAPVYPPPVPYQLATRTIATFRGETPLDASCTAGVQPSDSSVPLAATLRYQACTENYCLFPVTRLVTGSIWRWGFSKSTPPALR